MAYQWFDDFSRYGTGSASRTAMLDGLPYARLAEPSTSRTEVVADPDPNVTGRALLVGQGIENNWRNDNRVALPSPLSGKVGVHARYWFQQLPDTQSRRPVIVGWHTVSVGDLCTVLLQQNGSIIVRDGASATIADSVVPLISPRTWNHIEAWYDSDDGTGELYVNGIKRLDWATGTTGTTALILHAIRSDTGSGALRFYMKDYGIWDGSGTENNDVAGTVIVSRRNPIADVTLGGWIPSTGSEGYPLLAKNAPNDATYLSADDAPPAAMQYTFEPIDPDTTSVRAVMSVARMRKTDGGDANVQMSVSPNGTDWDDGADRPITSAFAYWFDISEISPATTDPWTPVEFADVIGQINRTV